MNITFNSPEEQKLLKELETRTDAEAMRMRRFLAMRDLSRTPGSPIHEIVQRILAIPDFKDFDDVKAPEIVPTKESFDLFDFPADHPARSRSDTYYLNDDYILRTHTTISWYYYFLSDYAKKKMAADEPMGVLCYGKVYRKDEIDRRHMNIFHQIDGYYLLPKSRGELNIEDLKASLVKIAQAVFGREVKYRFNPDQFPYTDPSLEMEIDKPARPNESGHSGGDGTWIEVLGSGIIKGSVLEKLGVDSKNYTGWAFGSGLERWAIVSMELPDIRLLWSDDERVKKQLKLGTIFKEVSKYPPIIRDISFVVSKDFAPNDYFDLIRDIGGDLVEEVSLLDHYDNDEKFGADKTSYTYRIIYRSTDRTLTTEEIDPLQAKIEQETITQFAAQIR